MGLIWHPAKLIESYKKCAYVVLLMSILLAFMAHANEGQRVCIGNLSTNAQLLYPCISSRIHLLFLYKTLRAVCSVVNFSSVDTNDNIIIVFKECRKPQYRCSITISLHGILSLHIFYTKQTLSSAVNFSSVETDDNKFNTFYSFKSVGNLSTNSLWLFPCRIFFLLTHLLSYFTNY